MGATDPRILQLLRILCNLGNYLCFINLSFQHDSFMFFFSLFSSFMMCTVHTMNK